MSMVIASSRSFGKKLIAEIQSRLNEEVIFFNDRKSLTIENLNSIKPQYVFFPHWSYIIPKEIHENFQCVIFHMTDLPFGRGGSPLQNLIVRGIYETQLSAIRCVSTLDGGDIYLKRPLSLWGSAEEIFLRAAEMIKEMIIEIVRQKPEPIPQQGDAVIFKRRTPSQSNIGELNKLNQIFDYIRMLDAEGYPAAFLETEYLRLEFSRATMKEKHILADVKISLREADDE